MMLRDDEDAELRNFGPDNVVKKRRKGIEKAAVSADKSKFGMSGRTMPKFDLKCLTSKSCLIFEKRPASHRVVGNGLYP